MVFKSFTSRLIFRVLLLTSVLGVSMYIWISTDLYPMAIFFTILAIFQVYELNKYVNETNRKLTRFLESVRYSDFITGFSSGRKMGSSFQKLDAAFNDVLDAFRKTRSDKEEHLQYLNTVVEHVNVGVISFDQEGQIGLINAAAKKLLTIDQIRSIDDLIEKNSRLYKALFDLPAGKSTLFKTKKDIQLSIHATEIRLGTITYKLVALQNIQPELQKKELEAWQNLTKILRHEIMNSITPIVSLTSTMNDILVEDLIPTKVDYQLKKDTADDLKDGLVTIQDRSKALIKFINAYRDYTAIPLPDIRPVSVKKLLQNAGSLLRSEFKNNDILFSTAVQPVDMIINIDEEQIEQVLINLLKNSMEALQKKSEKVIRMEAGINDSSKSPYIIVWDNGEGIIREALEKIFIPFYTTKKTGSGIGLALSRQILQLHHGTITVDSEPGDYTCFTLQF